jgi:[protein-PII] uridylyltransferase
LAPFLALREALADRAAPIARSWERLSDVMDAAVVPLSLENTQSDEMAVVALGGYGRRQLCVHSDIDLMLLVPQPIPKAPPVFRAMWDAGLAVGHAVRTPAEAAQAASERIDTACSMLDARLVGGSEALFAELQRQLGKRRRPARLAVALIDEERARRSREPHHLQAVDLKAGRGGLRTIQTLRWIDDLAVGHTALDVPRLAELEDVLLTTRQALHIAAGRGHDRMDFSLRPVVAAVLDTETRAVLSALYSAVREVDGIATGVMGLEEGGADTSGVGGRLFRSVRSRRSHIADASPGPWRAAADTARSGAPLSGVTADLAEGASWNDAERDAFVQLAGAGPRGRRVFDQLRASGFLPAAVPEWDQVISQPQLDPFHLHPVDDHLWRAAAEVMAVAGPEAEDGWIRDVAEELGSLDEVVLAALFHDVGKGTGEDHSIAGARLIRGFGERAGFDAITVDVVELLVREHLLLPQVATRHDLDDPGVIARVAETIGDRDVLRMLYLLTVADARATGPDVWTPWRGSLIRTLFSRSMEVLESGGARSTPLRAARVAEVADRIGAEVPADEINAHLDAMPETYALRTPASEVRRHLLLLRPPPQASEVRIDVVDGEEWSDVVVVTADRPGLLAVVSGVFALSNISILEARLATRTDGAVVDRFHVEDSMQGGSVPPERWETTLADLRATLAGTLDLEGRLATKHHHYRSLVDDTAQPSARLLRGADHGTHRIELRAADRVGLLHDVALVLQGHDVDVRFAKIDTQGGRVIDTFHVLVRGALEWDQLEPQLVAAADVP